MVDVVENVVVKSIRHTSDNGCVFTGQILSSEGEVTDESLNVLIPGRLQNNLQFDLIKGKPFLVSGEEWHEYINKHTGEVERQIKANKMVERKPIGKSFIHYVANSDKFPDVGVETAKALYEHFSTDIYKILDDKDFNALREVKGISDNRLYTIIDGWHEDNLGKVVEWLDLYGLPTGIGYKLMKAYGNQATKKIEADPYRLIAFTTWAKTDDLALYTFKIEKDDPRRLHAAVAEVLFNHYVDLGNTAVTYSAIKPDLSKLIGEDNVSTALTHVYSNGGFKRVGDELFQSSGAFLQESYLAREIVSRCMTQSDLPLNTVEHSLEHWESENYELTDEQAQAVRYAMTKRLSLITGGAGVGKTSVLEALNYVITELGGKSIQMALAGRAAKRLNETTGHDAKTIAGFLYTTDIGDLKDVSHIIIDECSMVDLYSFIRVLRMLDDSIHVVLVGDSAQLPPVGAGKVFHYLSDALFVPTTRLTKVWRQDETTGIPVVSQSLRNGLWDGLRGYSGKNKGVTFVKANKKNIYSMVEQVFDDLGNIKSDNDVKIICPTTSNNDWGTLGINGKISQKYLGDSDPIFAGYSKGKPKPTGFKIGDTVMATVNNWNKGYMNGSLGVVKGLPSEEEVKASETNKEPLPVMYVEFDSGLVLIDIEDIKNIQWGYAITCHKAQGSQFQRVIIPIINKTLIDRTWVYTALTRSVDQAVFIGDVDIIKTAVEAPPTALSRTTGLDFHFSVEGVEQ